MKSRIYVIERDPRQHGAPLENASVLDACAGEHDEVFAADFDKSAKFTTNAARLGRPRVWRVSYPCQNLYQNAPSTLAMSILRRYTSSVTFYITSSRCSCDTKGKQLSDEDGGRNETSSIGWDLSTMISTALSTANLPKPDCQLGGIRRRKKQGCRAVRFSSANYEDTTQMSWQPFSNSPGRGGRRTS